MTDLAQSPCQACHADTPGVTEAELIQLIKEIPDWRIVNRNQIMQLERIFSFKNFADAMTFTNAVGTAAEQENHHPALLTEWGKVTVTWWSHNIPGLHQNDFIMSARTDQIYNKLTS